MADVGQPQQIPEAPFPAPPPFWRHFTTANEAELKSLESSSQGQPPQKLPFHLAYLRRPPPPPSTTEFYKTFNQPHILDLTKPASLPVDQLLFDPDSANLNTASLLSKLTKSLLLNFLELTSILSLDATKFEDKLADLRQLLINVHVVINIYRPHQARENVKEMLEGILEDGEREIEECDRVKERVEDFLEQVGSVSQGGTVEKRVLEVDAGDEMMEQQKKLWKMIQDMT